MRQSLIDYPGHISAVVFTQGCNFRCVYCHNPELIPPAQKSNLLHPGEVLEYIRRYRHLLAAVAITGGEPTLHPALPDFIRRIKELDLKVKLDTNGTNPTMLALLLGEQLIDYVAMDIKAPLMLEKYRAIVGKRMNEEMMKKIRRSVQLLMDTSVPHEFRTTLVSPYHTPEEICQMISSLKGDYFLQKAITAGKTLTNDFQILELSPEEIDRLRLHKKEVNLHLR